MERRRRTPKDLGDLVGGDNAPIFAPLSAARTIQILHCIDHYLASRNGAVKKLKPPFTGFRLRCSDYRVFFDSKDENTIEITGVRHRREAYR